MRILQKSIVVVVAGFGLAITGISGCVSDDPGATGTGGSGGSSGGSSGTAGTSGGVAGTVGTGGSSSGGSANPQGSGVQLEWNAVSEFQNVGFNVYRSSDSNIWTRVNSALIAVE